VPRIALKYGAGLIALYLGLYYATNAGTLLTNGAQGVEGITKTFQARA